MVKYCSIALGIDGRTQCCDRCDRTLTQQRRKEGHYYLYKRGNWINSTIGTQGTSVLQMWKVRTYCQILPRSRGEAEGREGEGGTYRKGELRGVLCILRYQSY